MRRGEISLRLERAISHKIVEREREREGEMIGFATLNRISRRIIPNLLSRRCREFREKFNGNAPAGQSRSRHSHCVWSGLSDRFAWRACRGRTRPRKGRSRAGGETPGTRRKGGKEGWVRAVAAAAAALIGFPLISESFGNELVTN